jgi:hypothetical protein
VLRANGVASVPALGLEVLTPAERRWILGEPGFGGGAHDVAVEGHQAATDVARGGKRVGVGGPDRVPAAQAGGVDSDRIVWCVRGVVGTGLSTNARIRDARAAGLACGRFVCPQSTSHRRCCPRVSRRSRRADRLRPRLDRTGSLAGRFRRVRLVRRAPDLARTRDAQVDRFGPLWSWPGQARRLVGPRRKPLPFERVREESSAGSRQRSSACLDAASIPCRPDVSPR